jgi:hypothetical protein
LAEDFWVNGGGGGSLLLRLLSLLIPMLSIAPYHCNGIIAHNARPWWVLTFKPSLPLDRRANGSAALTAFVFFF